MSFVLPVFLTVIVAKRSERIFEFGTCTGRTANLWSRNANQRERIVTLTLSPAQQADYSADTGDAQIDTTYALSRK